MAFKGVCNFIMCCFASNDGEDDDTERIVDYTGPPEGPPVDGSPYRFEMDALLQIFNRKLNAVREELAETHRREIAALRNEFEENLATLAHAHHRDVDDQNERLRVVTERCDKLDSRVYTLNEQLRYEEPNFPTYSDNYVREDQEVIPQFSL